jgi:hypothetical protein
MMELLDLSVEVASMYLDVSDYNLERALDCYYENANIRVTSNATASKATAGNAIDAETDTALRAAINEMSHINHTNNHKRNRNDTTDNVTLTIIYITPMRNPKTNELLVTMNETYTCCMKLCQPMSSLTSHYCRGVPFGIQATQQAPTQQAPTQLAPTQLTPTQLTPTQQTTQLNIFPHNYFEFINIDVYGGAGDTINDTDTPKSLGYVTDATIGIRIRDTKDDAVKDGGMEDGGMKDDGMSSGDAYHSDNANADNTTHATHATHDTNNDDNMNNGGADDINSMDANMENTAVAAVAAVAAVTECNFVMEDDDTGVVETMSSASSALSSTALSSAALSSTALSNEYTELN